MPLPREERRELTKALACRGRGVFWYWLEQTQSSPTEISWALGSKTSIAIYHDKKQEYIISGGAADAYD